MTESYKKFEEIICLENPDTCTLSIDRGWGQGRTIFGGIVAASVFSKVKNFTLKKSPVRSLHYMFSSPCAPGVVDLSTNLVSSGKNIEIYSFLASQKPNIVLSGNAVFGKELNKKLSQNIAMPKVKNYRDIEPLPFVEGLTPEFIKNYEMRIAKGGIPFSGTKDNESMTWIRFRDSNSKTRVQHIIALLDAIPPPVLQMLDEFAPISTISWSIQILEHDFIQRPDQFWLVWCRADIIYEGYARTTAYVFDQDGKPAATANQTVGIFGG